MKCVVAGSGSWGTGLAQVLCDNGRDVTIWGICEDEVNDIELNHRNSKYFKDVILNENLHATTDFM